jgi:hypothetical protein
MNPPKYHVYGTKTEPPMKVKYRVDPLPDDLNREALEIADKFGYPNLVEIVKAAKRLKRYGTAHFMLNGIEVAKFDFWFGICMRVVFVQGDIGDDYASIQKKLKQVAAGKLVPFAYFMRSRVPESISTRRPHDRMDKRSPDFKKSWIEGKDK